MLASRLVDRERLGVLFAEIEPELYRFPAINPARFAERVRVILSA
jgi:hypothetical protein